MENLQHLVNMPYGCGEQNMLNFAPTIYVAKYLQQTNQIIYLKDSDISLNERSIKYMLIGYQKEMNYRHNDGSFSAFGANDKEGSLWLTSFVINCFSQAKEFIYIDQDLYYESIEYILAQQLKDGSFKATGYINNDLYGGLNANTGGATFSAYITLSLFEEYS